MKKTIQCLLLFVVVTVIIISNTRGLLQNYYSFYYPEQESKLDENQIYSNLKKVSNYRLYNLFATYTGLETGYGFFSPNVASDFIVYFTVYDKQNKVIKTTNFTPLNSKESLIRITTAYNMFLSYNKNNLADMETQKCLVLLKGLAHKNLIQNNEASKVKADLYLYHYPLLSQLKENKEMKPIQLFYGTKSFTFKSYENWD